MTASALLAELQGHGVQVEVTGGQLQFDAPRGAMRDLLPEIARFKTELLAILQHGDAYAPRAAPAADGARFWAEVATAIDGARRGVHLAYTPALSWAWKSANRATGRNLTSAQLCEVAQENHHL